MFVKNDKMPLWRSTGKRQKCRFGAERVNTTFKNISVTTFVAEIGVPREIHRPVASH